MKKATFLLLVLLLALPAFAADPIFKREFRSPKGAITVREVSRTGNVSRLRAESTTEVPLSGWVLSLMQSAHDLAVERRFRYFVILDEEADASSRGATFDIGLTNESKPAIKPSFGDKYTDTFEGVPRRAFSVEEAEKMLRSVAPSQKLLRAPQITTP